MKRKIYMIIAMMAMVTGSMAQPNVYHTKKIGDAKQRQEVKQLTLQNRNIKRVDAHGIIKEQPEGTLFDNLYRSSDYYYNDEGYISALSEDGVVGRVVEGTDGNVYIYNPFSGFNTEAWAKAERAEGDTIIVRGHQPIFAWEEEGGFVEVDSLDIFDIVETADEEGYYTFDVSYSPIQEAKFLWKDGTLKSVDQKVMGISTSSYEVPGTWEWAKVGERNLVMNVIEAQKVVLPEGVEMRAYKFHNDHENYYSDANVVNVGFKDSHVYLNVGSRLENAWIEGTIDGNTITFNTEQYLGSDNVYGRHIFFIAGSVSEVYDPYWDEYTKEYAMADNIVFSYNAETGAFSSKDAMFVNSGNRAIYYYDLYQNMIYEPFNEVAAVPQAPFLHMGPMVVDYTGSEPFAGYFIDTEVLFSDVDGNFINPNKLFFNVYIDEDIYTFTTQDYPMLENDMTDIPALFHDGYVFGQYGRFQMVNFCSQDLFFDADLKPIVKRVGVQSIYRGAGEERRSVISWWDVAAGQPVDAIENVSDNAADVVAVKYYDQLGRQVNELGRGIYIKVMHLRNGATKTVKIAH